ncbi:polyamine aminopropyltransferase [Luteibaculum oceani]|uniref:S-adenosylmethionine decarboxylase proenzyme n=1 Tax=Luteibaculum oceani TaxID=1294296 RepID=A0A5C6USC8_9FLAO|nr:polyamine aminopropyltransferase [Luteibaculum oceani]TXC76242.1 polyamine aminopropyltransferase [Luteibaculum oceani]
MTALGNHIIVEYMGCIPEIMNDVSVIEEAMVTGAEIAGATVINSTFHHFSPYGVSGVVVIQESHLAIHTWPEYGYAAVDLFTCGEMDAWISFDHLKKVFGAKNYSALEMRRGALNLLNRVDFDMHSMREEAKKHVNPGKYTRNVWFTDKDDNQALSLRHTGEVLYDKDSDIQKVRVIDTYGYGKTLTIDNMFMCTETDEAHYHEMISHPAMLSHGNVKRALVIGGGDGGTIRELVKHPSLEKVDMVEIDANVVEASKLHLPTLSSAFDHPKVNLQIADGIKFVNDAAPGTYDLIIVDGSDPVGPAEGLFSAKFYEACKKALNDNGLLVTQGESPMFNHEVFAELNTCLKGIFGKDSVNTLLFHIPTYPSGIWSFQIASKGNINPTKVKEDLAGDFEKNNALKYYSSALHGAAFILPNYIKKMLNE